MHNTVNPKLSTQSFKIYQGFAASEISKKLINFSYHEKNDLQNWPNKENPQQDKIFQGSLIKNPIKKC